MNIDKVIDVLERNLKVGEGNLRLENKPPEYQIAEATRQAISELKKLRLGGVIVRSETINGMLDVITENCEDEGRTALEYRLRVKSGL